MGGNLQFLIHIVINPLMTITAGEVTLKNVTVFTGYLLKVKTLIIKGKAKGK